MSLQKYREYCLYAFFTLIVTSSLWLVLVSADSISKAAVGTLWFVSAFLLTVIDGDTHLPTSVRNQSPSTQAE